MPVPADDSFVARYVEEASGKIYIPIKQRNNKLEKLLTKYYGK